MKAKNKKTTKANSNTTQANHPANRGYWATTGLMGILVRCCAAFGVTPNEVRSRSRDKCVVFAKQAYCYKAYRDTNQTTTNIALYIGRTHSTVSRSIKIVENYLTDDQHCFTKTLNAFLTD